MQPPIVNGPPEESAATLPRWTAEDKALWLDLFESFSIPLLPTDEDSALRKEAREQKAIEAVQLGARLADIAVREFQFRQFFQSDEAGPGRAEGELSFEDFSGWLARTRAPRRARSTVARRRKR
jgi:hypothetical protein